METGDDAFGRALRAQLDGEQAYEVTERDDGHVDAIPVATYFSAYDEWPPYVREAVDRVEGRVLDLGCGAGRHALHLQERGHDVLGVDVSPGAVAVCEERGLEWTAQADVVDLDQLDETFDAVLMLGNNFGLLGTSERAPTVLRALDAVTASDAVVFAESIDPHDTEDPAHLAYHEHNRERGRLPGAVRIRVRFRQQATDWLDYLHASPSEMEDVVAESAWSVRETFAGDGPGYVGVLEKS